MINISKPAIAPLKPGLRGILLLLLGTLISACEAPLNLEQVSAEEERVFRRYDLLQAATHSGPQVVVVSSAGALMESDDNGQSWQRLELPGRPPLIDVTACPDGSFHALDSERRVWTRSSDGSWQSVTIDTLENTLSIHCAPGGRLWVSASFSTLYWSESPQDGDWTEFSLYEDLQFTAVRFVDDETGFALGEFGTVVATTDGGDSWDMLEPIPNEFYPMAVDFRDANTGWAGGLDGVIWETRDGGQSWEKQTSVTSAPVYNIHAGDSGVFAVGGSAKAVKLIDGKWSLFPGAPDVLAFMRAIDTLDDGSLLLAGGGGLMAVISTDLYAAR